MIRSRSLRIAIAALAVALALASTPAAMAAAQQAAPPKITEIVVRGNKSINRESIVASSGLKVGDPVTQASLDAARTRVLNMGLFGIDTDNPEEAVKVSAQVTGESAVVTIEVQENSVVQRINISGTGPVPAADLLPLLQTKQGSVLDMNTLRTDTDRIRKYYEDKGYVITWAADTFGLKDGTLNLPIIVARVGKVRVLGLHKTRPRVVLREMGLKEGSYFNLTQYTKDVKSVWNTDLFGDISPNFLTTPGVVDITLNLTEKRTGNVGAGIGYSNRQRLVGRVEVSETNFLGRGQQVNALWETGGLANRNSVELGFTEPWLDRRHTSLSVSLYDRTVYRFGRSIGSDTGGPVVGTSKDYFETHTGGQVALSRPFGQDLRGLVGFRYDNVRVPSLDLNANDAAILQNGPLADITLRATHNTRDFDTDPATGGLEILTTDLGRADLKPVLLSNGQAPAGVFGSVNFTKGVIDARRYISLQGRRLKPTDRRHVIALRVMVGTSTGVLPFSEQYFVGGAETLRGYFEDRFWGKSMALGSVEFRAPLANALTGVLFADVGDAWGGPYEKVAFSGFSQHSGFSPNLGIGLGIRVVTPIGPIRIDQGFGREGARTHFSIGHVF